MWTSCDDKDENGQHYCPYEDTAAFVHVECNRKRGTEMKIPIIIKNRRWLPDDVRQFCLKHGYYTRGDCCDYEAMLRFISETTPNEENMYRVALNILNHSGYEIEFGTADPDIIHVMFELEKEVVDVFYDYFGRE